VWYLRVGEYDVREGLYYSKEHEWAKAEQDKCRVGVADYAQQRLHEVVYAELPRVGSKVSQGESLGTVESVKAVADVFSPISGEVIEVNERLRDSPELINKTPYDEGWIAVIRSSKPEEFKNLMDAAAYSEFLKSLAEKEG